MADGKLAATGFEKEVIAEIIGIGATKAIGKIATNLLAAATKGHLEKSGNRLSSMLVGMPEEVEKVFTVSVAYALRKRMITKKQHNAYWTRLARLPREKNNLYRLITVQTWVDEWMSKEDKNYMVAIDFTAEVIALDAKMAKKAWKCKVEVLDLDQPVLPFSLKKRIRQLEKEKRELKAHDQVTNKRIWIAAGILSGIAAVVLIFIFIVTARS